MLLRLLGRKRFLCSGAQIQEFVIKWKGRKNKRLSATLKVPAWASSPQGERRVRGGRLEGAAGNLPNPFGHPENTSTSRFQQND
jgi:hypothetical protein